MKKELKELKLTKNVIIPFPNFQQNTIISPTQMNDNFEEIEYAYNNLIDNHNGAIQNLENAINAIPSKEELKGERGEKGDKGDKGDKGEPGDIANIDLSHIENQLDNKPNYVVANSFEGSNGGEKIQNALNSSYSGNGIKVVVVDSKCGNEDMWLITSPLKIPSNTCLLLNGCYLKLANGVNNAIINNSDFDNGNKNVHIVGVGNPVLDCNRNGQNSLLNNYKNIGLHLYNVDGFSIKGVTLKDCTKWSLVPERCKNGFIEDIVFDNKGYVNQDGVHIIGPSTKITCAKIRGVVGDDACVINARTSGGGTGTFQGYGTGGDVTDILFSDVNIEGGIESHTGILRTSASPTTKVDNIMLVNAIGHNLTDALVRVGGNDTTNADLHGGITVNNVTGHAKDGQGIRLVRFLQNASNVKITNAKVYSESKSSIVDTANVTVKNLTIDNIDYAISEKNTVLTNGLSAFRLRTSTIINFEANNIRHIDNVGAIDYSNSLIITGSGSTLDNIHINGFTGLNITGLIDATKVTSLGKVRFDNYKINDAGFTANSYNNNINNVITNGLVKMTGSTSTPQESICNIGDVIRYKASGSSKYINYIKLAPNTYKEIAEVDLSNYYTSAQTDSKIAQEIAKAQLGGGSTSSGGNTNNETLLMRYVHTSNRVIQPIAVDIATGVFTTAEPHGLTTGNKLMLDFTNMSGGFNQTKILKELITFNWTTWYFMIAEVVSDTEFKLKNGANNNYITFTSLNTLDLSSFRFQVSPGNILLKNIGMSSYKKVRINMNLYTLSQTYVDRIEVAKIITPTSVMKQESTMSKMSRWLRPGSFMYPNKSLDVGDVSVYGHSASYRQDIIENILTLKETALEREVKAMTMGYANVATSHDNNSMLRMYNFKNVFDECGYSNGNSFLDNVEIHEEHKILNGSVIEIYGSEV